MKAPLMLGIAIVAEVVATSALKASAGFSKGGPVILTVLSYGVAFYFLGQALRTIPVGIAYAIWSGVGIVLISATGWLVFGQRLNALALLGMALIIAGVLILNLVTAAPSPGG